MSDVQMNVLYFVLGILLWVAVAFVLRKKAYPRFLLWFSTSFSIFPLVVLGIIEGAVFGVMKSGILFTMIYAYLLVQDYQSGKREMLKTLDVSNPEDFTLKFLFLKKIKEAFVIRIIIFAALSIFFSLEISKG